MKILVFSSVFPNEKQPTMGLFIRERMFRVAKNCELMIVAPVPWFPGAKYLKANYRPSISRFEIQQGIEVYRPKFLSFPGIFKCFDGFLLCLSILWALRQIKKSFNFDIIDAHFAYPEGFAAVLLGKIFRKPVTITLRGTIIPLSNYLLRKIQIRYALKRATRVFSVCFALKKKAVELGVSAEKITVIPNGVDTTMFSPIPKQKARKMLGLPLEKKIIISVGGMVKRKGFHRIIELLPEISRSIPEVYLIIVGGASVEGNCRAELDEQIRKLKIGDRVVFTGIVTQKDIYKWLSAANIFCLTTSNEGWANVFLEAMACGLPVVTTNVGGNGEVVCNQRYGILVELNEPEELMKAIIRALTQKWDKEEIINYARKNSWDQVAQRVIKEFHTVISSRGQEHKPVFESNYIIN